MNKGMVHVYHGDGKGKTTASLGLAIRALGNGWRVCIVQFLKGSASGEVAILEKLPEVTILRGKAGTKFSYQMNEKDKAAAKQVHQRHLEQAMAAAHRGEYDLLVLDEAVGACNCGLLDEETLLEYIESKPTKLEIVLTGRNPGQRILKAADYVTEMKMQKHPFEQGAAARRGVEF